MMTWMNSRVSGADTIPPELGGLRALRELSLAENQLSGERS